jgi:prepilin-type N-terminal cleavage/methylation domain-containing protein
MQAIANRKFRGKGFTLPELLIALSVFAIVIALVINFYKEALVETHLEAEKNELNSSLRNISEELLLYARQADYMLIYKSFDPRNHNNAEDRLFEGKEGDLLIMVFQGEGKKSERSNKRSIVKIVGYYREGAGTKKGESKAPLKRFIVEIPEGSSREPEALIPKKESKKFKELASNVSGLTHRKVFYNLNNKNIMVNMSLSVGSGNYEYSHWLNLTLSPKD